jgi:putative Holliday junction resolvase
MIDNPIKILGIDPGDRRVGLAIADSGLGIATGFGVIEYGGKKRFIEKIGSIASEEDISLIVMGLPMNMNGSEGEAAKKSRRLAESIKEKLNIEVELVDERLTTHQAIKHLHEAGGKTGSDKGRVDMLSAIVILQSYLDGKASKE